MGLGVWVKILVFCNTFTACMASVPIAPHLFFAVSKGGEVEIPLIGYDLDGDQLVTTITSLPGSGSLYQLSQVYSDYGYLPKHGSMINTPNVNVSGSGNRVMYRRPAQDIAVVGKWATFKYTVRDNDVSHEGTVTLVQDNLLTVGSFFATSDEGWRVVGNGNGAANVQSPAYEATSRGVMNRYIHSTDAVLHIDHKTGDDQTQWYFNAPTKFLGNQGINYGGVLEFDLSSFSGDFSSSNLNSDLDLVVLECSKCAVNSGMRLVRRLGDLKSATAGAPLLSFSGRATHFSIHLLETSGWLKDPKNTLVDWAAPSRCDMVEVLSGLSSVRVLGDSTKWYESVALDNVKFVAGGKIPICAQHLPDASVCTCA